MRVGFSLIQRAQQSAYSNFENPAPTFLNNSILKFEVVTAVLGQGIAIVTNVYGWIRGPAKGVICNTLALGKVGEALIGTSAIVTA